MKLIHLSDLHLGKRVNEFSMIEDQEHILIKILNIIDEEKPDAVLIAGDVYDRSTPSEEAMKLFDDFLVRLSQRINQDGKQLQTFVISGNHDSAGRIAFGNRLMAASGVHLSSVFDGKAEKYTLQDNSGPVNIYMLPFIKPLNVKLAMRKAGEDEDAISKISTYTDAISWAVQNTGIDENERNVLIAHQYVTGSERSDSEEIIGGLDNVDAKAFAGFDYVALGHLHRPQTVQNEETIIRYCGSPIKYSFSEMNDRKSVTVIELERDKACTVRTVPVTPLHEMHEIKGKFDELMQKSFYERTDYTDAYMRVILTDEDRIPDAIARMRNVYENIMTLEYENVNANFGETTGGINVEEKTPMEIFQEFYLKVQGRDMSSEQEELIEDLIEDVWEDER